MKKTTTLLFLLLSTFANGQTLFNKTFNKPNWDYSGAVIERNDGKYLVAGSSRSQFQSDYDVNLILIDTNGNLIWDKYIGKTPNLEFAYSMIETNDGNYVIVGGVDSSPYLLKINSSGNLIWDKNYHTSLWMNGYSIGQSFDNNYYFVSPTPEDKSTTLYKTSANGDSLWSKRYIAYMCHSVIQTSDSGFALTGVTNITSMKQDISLIKTNSVGDTLWSKTYGGKGYDNANSIQQLSDNGYLIAGNYDNLEFDSQRETYIIRTNSKGDTLWTKKHRLGYPQHIQKCSIGGGYILSSTVYITSWSTNPDKTLLNITKLDTLGNIQWSRMFDGDAYNLGNNVTQTSDGGFLLTGHIKISQLYTDIILIKLNKFGDYVMGINDILKKPSFRSFNLSESSKNGIKSCPKFRERK